MMWFKRKPRTVENTRRTKRVPVKKPSVWKHRTKRLLVFGLLLFGMGGLAWKMNHVMTVTHWKVDAPAHIKQHIHAYFRQKESMDFWHTRAARIQHDLREAIPDIREIEVSRVLPDGLVVRATARQPVALWTVRNRVMLVDAYGAPYRQLRHGEALDLPLLRMPEQSLRRAVEVLRSLAQARPERAHDLSEIIVEHDDWRLNFAHGEQWQLAQARLTRDLPKVLEILEKPRWSSGHWRMDARISGRWFMRPAKQEVI